MKISCKSVQPFSRNLADKETKKQRYEQTKKSIENNSPSPDLPGTDNNFHSARGVYSIEALTQPEFWQKRGGRRKIMHIIFMKMRGWKQGRIHKIVLGGAHWT